MCIELLGICGERLGAEAREIVAQCNLVAHSRRQEPLLQGIAARRVLVTPLAPCFADIAQAVERGERVAVLASGDPLFFGIGRQLVAQFGAAQVRVRPALSALQLACARLGEPWDNLAVLSLHGAKGAQHQSLSVAAGRLLATVCRTGRVLALTDPCHSPERLAQAMQERLQDCKDHERLSALRLAVAENLGLHDERLTGSTLPDIASNQKAFSPLNVLFLKIPQEHMAAPRFGLAETAIQHSRGLITKNEVRAATLHGLHLPEQGVFWDIGGGSGSVSLEAAALAPDLDICVTEKNPAEQANIRANIRTFGAYRVQLIPGEAPEALAALPAPERVFIGGSGGRLAAILEQAAHRLKPQGRIVVNAVLQKTALEARKTLAALGYTPQESTITVSRTVSRKDGTHTQTMNPITIITGTKP